MSKPFFRSINATGVQKLRELGVTDQELLALKHLGVILDVPRMIPLTTEQMDRITNATCIADQESGYSSSYEAIARGAIEAYLEILEENNPSSE
jgi:hypothetical protein